MEKAKTIIKHFESLHDGDSSAIGLQPKLCPADVWTVGWGHAVIDPATGKYLKGANGKKRAYELYPALTEAEADVMLQEDYGRTEAQVNDLLTKHAEPYEIAAMTSLAYNIGMGNFRKSSVLRFFNAANKAMAAESFKLWVKAAGVKLRGLERRRWSEAHLFLHNEVKFLK
jgi:GH24 family phage-related lysozyme (muramidase)